METSMRGSATWAKEDRGRSGEGRDWLITAGDLLGRERKTGVVYLFRQKGLLRV